MVAYNFVYIPFNLAEALAWFAVACVVAIRFRMTFLGTLQVVAFMAFGASDIIECYGTTPLLLLFKGALIVALLQGRKNLVLRKCVSG